MFTFLFYSLILDKFTILRKCNRCRLNHVVDTETYLASPHSSWALDTAPDEEHGELSLFNDFRQLQCGCA